MVELILGPLLRHVSDTSATIWVETDAPCEVEVLGHTRRTFQIAGHHYAILSLPGLAAGSTVPYTVSLDGVERWPEAGSSDPPSLIRTLGERPLELVFGSCRVAAPHAPPYTDSHGADALSALAVRMRHTPPASWPDALLLLGDQVYADVLSPATRTFIRQRRSHSEPPFLEVADFEEYTRLYWDSWSDPPVRWLLSNLPTAMIFDDHDIHDDWNTSAAWRAEMAAKPWWRERIIGGLVSYWCYQHLGNLAPEALAADELYKQARQTGDAAPLLREFAARAAATTDGSQWSYAWQLGTSRLLVIDSRAGRVLTDHQRDMLDEAEWRFIEKQMRSGQFDHLLLATSVPFLLPSPIHDLEAWNEAICAGAWGRLAARLGERIRRVLDLEHWAAFERAFKRLAVLITSVATGSEAPASIVVLSGDVHYAYLANAELDTRARAAVYQVVCSPLRNALSPLFERATRAALSKPAERAARLLARWTRVAPPPFSWTLAGGPWFNNQLATLRLDGREAVLRLERATSSDHGPSLEPVWQRPLTPEEA
jgi:PhoD-like phosphatase